MHVINLNGETPSLKNTIIQPIHNALNKKSENFMLIIDGKPGIGKSGSAIELARLVDPTFDASRICMTNTQFMNLMRLNPPLQPGSAVLFDEAGEALGARSALDRKQRGLMVFHQAYRVLGLFVIYTVPNFMFLDKQLRLLAHGWAHCYTKNTAKGLVRMRVKYNSWSLDRHGDPIYRYPTVLSGGQVRRVTSVPVQKPPVILWHSYEKIKTENLDRMAKQIHNDDPKVKEEKQKKPDSEYVELIEKDMDSLLNCFKRVDWRLVKNKYDLTFERAKCLTKVVNSKHKLDYGKKNK